MKFLMSGFTQRPNFEGIGANVLPPARLFRLFNDNCSLSRQPQRTNGQQKAVEQVHNHDGGHAIVGAIVDFSSLFRAGFLASKELRPGRSLKFKRHLCENSIMVM